MKSDRINYILYGAASIGNLVKEALDKCGVTIVGYIDKRAYELTVYNGLPVWDIETVPEEYRTSSTYVYISVKNVFEHEKIADMLYSKGYCYIVYKPYNVLLGYGNKDENLISEIYDNMFSGIYNKELELPMCQVGSVKEAHDYALINRNDDNIVAYIPSEFIFTNNYQNTDMEKWGNICILAFFTHIDFFRFLSNDNTAKPDDYLQEYCVFTANLQKKIVVTDAWKRNVIENRSQIYEQMKDALDLDPEFFIRNAAEAKWNEQKKCFNLISGKHRCTFQVAVGKKYLPLKISESDYEKFLNNAEIDNTMRIMQKTGKEAVISHPCFYRGMLMRERDEYQFFLWFARYYGRKTYYETDKVNLENISILDWSDDFGNFARFGNRIGCKVKRMLNPEPLESQLNCLFNETINYNSKIDNMKGNIICLSSDNLDIIDKNLWHFPNTWIIRNISRDKMEQLIYKYHLHIILLISVTFQDGNKVYSYLAEGDEL